MTVQEVLPRQTYKTDGHAKAEDRVANVFAVWARAEQLRIGVDVVDRQKPRVDRLLYREHVVAFFEVKTCRYAFGSIAGWTIGERS